jgi:alkanesulfonate monooxygenase SsuD/methylene tetrahydromethanopterin reductase-like flavin-dependent oxidoreductase (luciferase family)
MLARRWGVESLACGASGIEGGWAVAGGMKFALYGLHRDPDGLATLASLARAAEEAGFEGLWVGDHVALSSGPGDDPRLEALVALTSLAAVTSRIRLAFEHPA